MKEATLYAYGRSTVNGKWEIDRSRIVNRLYFVNGGTATIGSGRGEYALTAGKAYIIPACKNFSPLSAAHFDHTFFDFYTARILHPEHIVEIDGGARGVSEFFALVNALTEGESIKEKNTAMEDFLCGFLALINDACAPLPYLENDRLTRAIRIIHDEYPTVTTAALAKRLALNESFFIRSFTAAVGLSPMKYIRAIRISYGKALMQGGISVAEAAEKCGYSSPSAFYNAVKAELGVSPSQLIK
jgi:AraC-like DNA-binding protein